MDARLRLLTRQYAATRDPLLAVKVAEELLRSGAGGDITVYEVEYENLEGFRMDEKFSCGVFLTEQEAHNQLSERITEDLNYYRDEMDEEEKEAGEHLWYGEISKLLSEGKILDAATKFMETFSVEYRINHISFGADNKVGTQ